MFDRYRETTFSPSLAGQTNEMQIELMERGCDRGSTASACRLVLAALLLISAWSLPPAFALEMTSLYSVEVPLDPDDPDSEASAYRAAMAEVLVRVTGTTAAANSEDLAALFPNPRQYVTQYQPGPDDTLIVTLDGPAIEKVLQQSGATVWGTDRPLTIVWLAVDWGLGDREIVAGDDPDRVSADGRTVDRNRLLRERVQAVATRRGLPVVFPLLDVEDIQNIGFSDIWGGFDDPLLEASARYGAPSVLVGRIRPDEVQPPRWTWYLDGQRFAWPGQPEEAMDQLADALAARDAIRGDEEAEMIELTISGVSSVVAFGRIQQYLENLRGIQRLAISSVAADRIVYEVEVQGGTERLGNMLAVSSMLERRDQATSFDSGSYGANNRRGATLEFEYRPPPAPTMDADPVLRQDGYPES
jgi:hypothetical protein